MRQLVVRSFQVSAGGDRRFTAKRFLDDGGVATPEYVDQRPTYKFETQTKAF